MKRIGFIVLLLFLANVCFAARTFDGSTQYFERLTTFSEIADFPFSVSAWVNCSAATAKMGVYWYGDKDTDNRFCTLVIRGDVTGDPASARQTYGTAHGMANSTSGIQLSTWHPVVAVFPSASSRTIYIDGDYSDTNTTSVSGGPAGYDTMAIGRFSDLSPDSYLSGVIAEVGVWKIALSQDDVNNLSLNKYAPNLVQNANLVAWWKLDEESADANAADSKNGYILDQYASPGVADHPPGIIYSLADGEGGKVPVIMNSYRKRRNQ